MRLRNLKDKDILLDNCDYLIREPDKLINKWKEEFQNNKPIHLEIGMGKGDFIYEMALNNPDINFIGIEKYSGVIARAIKKYPNRLANLRIINMNALDLKEVFNKEIAVIYLNFSDPWPKKRQEDRRLTSPIFLSIYEDIFKDEKKIIMKTDNLGLLASSIVNLSNFHYIFKEVSLDLASSGIVTVLTEYEKKFREQGVKINYLEAEKRS